ncbi:YceI family protein [Flagellimonas zhangzhouensis]|uniref:Polyisoprenoid-binding protein YceI n=1 Tax=Flagellimonas zhangzhouensis TaxID=1073328 RepID=A0A1H2YN98_9FLAO|nr:YceI family protein [Allomuricauda zhangzhouensis]SDR01426.1 Polyisoprenoid-binding protein YceI [Allomuricauda zhangzhouensis]SDX06461.1 Polyisoprenoid-binding protein YceI [Allomuricauda zhangzhouensis]
MRKLSFFLALVLVGATVQAQSTWKSDGAHSKVGFSITHLMISEVEGSFGEFDITATAGDDFDNASFEVDIKVASIDTDNGNRDNHLKSPDFFDAEKYPSITFKSSKFEKTGDKTFKVTGDLSMHGVTKTVTLDGKVNGIITDQRSQKLKAGLKLTGTVNRLEFGVGGDTPTLGDDVELTVNLEMAQQ